MRKRAMLLAAVVCAPALVAQDVLIVDKNHGAGWEFERIQPAVDAAQDGDIVLVRAGIYYDESLKIIAKGITVTADAGADVRLTEGVTVRDNDALQTVVLRGLRLEPDTWWENSDKYGLRASACAGAVWVDTCSLIASNLASEGGTLAKFNGADLSGCDLVVFVNCVVMGGHPSAGDAGTGLRSKRSRVVAFGSRFLGHKITSSSPDVLPGDGAVIESGWLYAAGAEFVGGAAAASAWWAHGLVGLQSEPTLLDPMSFAPPTEGGDVVLQDSTLLNLPGGRRELTVDSPVREGDVLSIAARGAGGELVTLLVSLSPHQQLAPVYDAPLLVAPPPALMLPLGSISSFPAGVLNVSFPVPFLPAVVEGLVVHFQALFNASGEKRLSNPTAVILLDSSL